jgi:hypothetical protein
VASGDTESVFWGDAEWLTAEQAVEDWVKRVLGKEGVTVKWRDRPEERAYQAPCIEIAFGDEVPVGTDETSFEETTDGKLRTRITGYREVMLSLRMRTRDHGTFRQARRYMGMLRQSLEHPLYENLLRDAGLGYTEAEPVRTPRVTSEDGTRWESYALLEVRFGIVMTYLDEDADNELGWVDRVGVAVNYGGVGDQTSVNGQPIVIDVRPSVINPPED